MLGFRYVKGVIYALNEGEHFLGPHMTPGKGYGCSELQKLSVKFLIFVKF